MTRRTLSLLLLVNAWVGIGWAQRGPDHDAVVVPQNRIDARDLGYPPVDIIPNGDSAITSLTVAPNGNVYGATSGKHSYLFVLNPRHGYVQPLGMIPDATAITHALVVANSGEVYIGTSPRGHLLKYVPHDEDDQPIRIMESCALTDLGVAIQGETLSALAIDREAKVIYGLTSPNAHFIKYDIVGGSFTDAGVVAKSKPEGEKFETRKMFSQMLALDASGNVYASGENGFLYKFDPAKQTLEKLPLQAPAIPGRERWTQVECFLTDPGGLIYGGTSDGYLFRFDPAKLTVTNLGKPLLAPEITGLALAPDGKIYGVGGSDQDMARLFSYDPAEGAYNLLGFVDVNRRPYYSWQAYEIKAVTSGLDGTIYLGESERISRLYLFFPIINAPEDTRGRK
jgi:outer membrane protein assembly factor BamB